MKKNGGEKSRDTVPLKRQLIDYFWKRLVLTPAALQYLYCTSPKAVREALVLIRW
jgi:hypothetical protein